MADEYERDLGRAIALRIMERSGAKFSAEGAVFSAPKALAEMTDADAERCAETMLYGLRHGGGICRKPVPPHTASDF